MRVGITATRNLDRVGRDNIVAALARLMGEGVEAVIVGGCVGGDAWAGQTAKRLGFWVKVILPENTKELDPGWESYADEADGAYPYRERNTRIVEDCTVLLAFPDHPEQHPKSLRSGTWMTVRIAQRMGRPVQIALQHETRPPRPTTVAGRLPKNPRGPRQRPLTSPPDVPKLPGSR